MTFFTKSGSPCFHEGDAIPLISSIISEYDPDIVIELGTKNGGFTEVIQNATKDSTKIFTYDHIRYKITGRFRSNVTFVVCDILTNPVEDIVNICESDNKVLLYCDNGNKTREIELYSKYLKKGDMLGVHDWKTEVFYVDVKQYLERFTSIQRKEFKDAGWKTRFWKRG